jgi:hypothetical protein
MCAVRVWSGTLSENTIREWSNQAPGAGHPQFGDLVAWYPVTNDYQVLHDESGNQYDGEMLGKPQLVPWRASEMALYQPLSLRPDVSFRRTVYSGEVIDTTIESQIFPHKCIQLVEFANPGGDFIINDNSPNHPGTPTDTLELFTTNIYYICIQS